jgi:hypothetical protein
MHHPGPPLFTSRCLRLSLSGCLPLTRPFELNAASSNPLRLGFTRRPLGLLVVVMAREAGCRGQPRYFPTTALARSRLTRQGNPEPHRVVER